ncbi:MAG: hypothetical protein J6L88_00945 [Clostridia bacterium]|nr:hypothetical protein [Clostridia bacterium]
MNKRFKTALCLLLIMAMLMGGCGKAEEPTFNESSIAFLDNVYNDGSKQYVLLWQERPTAYKRLTSVINVLAPTWLYLSDVDGKITLTDTAQMGDTVDYANFVQLADKDQIQVWASVVSEDASFTKKLLDNEDLWQAFADKIVSFAETSGVQGINIYFEELEPEDRDAFTSLITFVRQALGENVMLNTCVHFSAGGSANEDAYDYVALSKQSDHLLLMAFEQYGLFSDTAGPICSYDWLYNNILKILSMVSSRQLVLVMPFYGRDFRFDETGASLWPGNPTQGPVVSYAQVEELYLQSQYYDSNEELTTSADSLLQEEWDKTYHSAYVKFTDTEGVMHVIWYDNEQSMADKTAIAVQYAFAGVGAYDDGFSDTVLWKGIRTSVEQQLFSPRMMTMLEMYTYSMEVYNPETEKTTSADAIAKDRLLNLLSTSCVAPSSGIDTGYVLSGELRVDEEDRQGHQVRWIVKEKNGRYLLVPDNPYTSIITSGQCLWLPVGITPEILEGICLVQQPMTEG